METLFPPTTAEEVARMSLERCVRLMPHELDSSGFFVAVFEKVGVTWPLRDRLPVVVEKVGWTTVDGGGWWVAGGR